MYITDTSSVLYITDTNRVLYITDTDSVFYITNADSVLYITDTDSVLYSTSTDSVLYITDTDTVLYTTDTACVLPTLLSVPGEWTVASSLYLPSSLNFLIPKEGMARHVGQLLVHAKGFGQRFVLPFGRKMHLGSPNKHISMWMDQQFVIFWLPSFGRSWKAVFPGSPLFVHQINMFYNYFQWAKIVFDGKLRNPCFC